MKTIIALLTVLCVQVGVDASELWMTNDSPFPLRAQVYGAGVMYEEQTVAPGTQWHWNNDTIPSGPASDPNTLTTAYTVIWYCAQGGAPYGTNTNMAAGSWVSAQSSSGQKICPIPKKPPANTMQRAK